MRYESVLEAIGHTPLVRLPVPAPDGVVVYGKLELQNLYAMKDRVARQMVLDARASGELSPGAPIIESSSGTMALGLALVGTALGHPVHIVTDPRIDPITLAKLEALGCAVHVVPEMTGAGWQSARLEQLARLMSGLEGAFWPRQYSNARNPAAYRALADELCADLPEGSPDVLVGSVGSGGSLCGSARALLERRPGLRVVGVDCVGSVLFAQPDLPHRRQSGLGNSLQPENLDYALLDEVHWLSDDEAFEATRRLAREQRIFAGNTSGSVYRVLCHLAARAEPGTTLVGILPDRGDRYVDGVYRAPAEGSVSKDPVEVTYGTLVTSWSYARIPRELRPRMVFIESNTTGTGMIALSTAARLGTRPVLLTGRPERYAGLSRTPARVVRCDTNDPGALRRAVDALAAEPGGLAGITTTSEYYLLPAAELAASYRLPGNAYEAVAACRDKAVTREALKAAAVGQPRYAVVGDPERVAAAVTSVGLPCVVKPVDDSGSNGVLRCDTASAAERHARRLLTVTENVRGQAAARRALVEQCVEGPEFSVEMFSMEGHHVPIGITARTLTPPPHFVEVRHIFPAPLPEAVAERVTGEAARVLKAIGIELGASHLELRLTEAGATEPRMTEIGVTEIGVTEVSVMEVNARPAGGMIPELIELATGVNLLEQQLRACAGLPVRLAPTRARHAGIRFLTAPTAGTLRAIDGVATARAIPGVQRIATVAAPGRAVRPPRSAYDRLGHIIAVADTAEEVAALLAEAAGHLRVEVDAPRAAGRHPRTAKHP